MRLSQDAQAQWTGVVPWVSFSTTDSVLSKVQSNRRPSSRSLAIYSEPNKKQRPRLPSARLAMRAAWREPRGRAGVNARGARPTDHDPVPATQRASILLFPSSSSPVERPGEQQKIGPPFWRDPRDHAAFIKREPRHGDAPSEPEPRAPLARARTTGRPLPWQSLAPGFKLLGRCSAQRAAGTRHSTHTRFIDCSSARWRQAGRQGWNQWARAGTAAAEAAGGAGRGRA